MPETDAAERAGIGLHPFDMIAIRANPRGGPLQAGVEQPRRSARIGARRSKSLSASASSTRGHETIVLNLPTTSCRLRSAARVIAQPILEPWRSVAFRQRSDRDHFRPESERGLGDRVVPIGRLAIGLVDEKISLGADFLHRCTVSRSVAGGIATPEGFCGEAKLTSLVRGESAMRRSRGSNR